MSVKKKGKKAIKTKKIALVQSVEENPKYIALLEENQHLEMNNNMLRQEIDKVINENEQKDIKINDLELELKFSAFQR